MAVRGIGQAVERGARFDDRRKQPRRHLARGKTGTGRFGGSLAVPLRAAPDFGLTRPLPLRLRIPGASCGRAHAPAASGSCRPGQPQGPRRARSELPAGRRPRLLQGPGTGPALSCRSGRPPSPQGPGTEWSIAVGASLPRGAMRSCAVSRCARSPPRRRRCGRPGPAAPRCGSPCRDGSRTDCPCAVRSRG